MIIVYYIILFMLSILGLCLFIPPDNINGFLLLFKISGLFVFVVGLLHLLGYLIYLSTPKGKKELGNSIETIPFTHISGLSEIPENTPVTIKVTNNTLVIQDLQNKNCENIVKSEILDLKILSEQEITEREKSVIARAIVGGIVFGIVGAVVGGMTGLGTKKETQIKNFVKIQLKNDKEVFLVPFMNSIEPANLLIKRFNM